MVARNNDDPPSRKIQMLRQGVEQVIRVIELARLTPLGDVAAEDDEVGSEAVAFFEPVEVIA